MEVSRKRHVDDVREVIEFIKSEGKGITRSNGGAPSGQVGWKQERAERVLSVSRYLKPG
jgi:hypothetical protein